MEQIEKLRKIREFYSSLQENLKIKLDDAVSKIHEILKDKGYEEGKDYILSARVKKPESLYEKIFRKNKVKYITSNYDTFDKLCNGIKIDPFFCDVLGVKIETLILKPDVLVDKIISDLSLFFGGGFETKGGFTTMINGLRFYKAIGHREDYQVEVQCSSIIQSAWSDIEHSNFYKDYSYYFEKDNNKKIVSIIRESLSANEDILRVIDEKSRSARLDINFSLIKDKISIAASNVVKEIFDTDMSLDRLYAIIAYLIEAAVIDPSSIGDIVISADEFYLSLNTDLEIRIWKLIKYDYQFIMEFLVIKKVKSTLSLESYFEHLFRFLSLQCEPLLCFSKETIAESQLWFITKGYLEKYNPSWSDKNTFYDVKKFALYFGICMKIDEVFLDVLPNGTLEDLSTVIQSVFQMIFTNNKEKVSESFVQTNFRIELRKKLIFEEIFENEIYKDIRDEFTKIIDHIGEAENK